ncbi:MAG: hypothetical protein M1828_004049 [Chrysothrix sp. TS-e1954]|nr:MAG: hypothetical protein M1828_004049 [Chrysothrix sp. TS-e1954]
MSLDPFRQPASPAQLHDTLAPNILAQCIVLIVVPTLAVVLRFWARLIKPEWRLWWDDWLILVALLVCNGFLATYIAQVPNGLGKHIQTVEPTKLLTFLKLGFATALLYNVLQCSYKLAAIALYLRVFWRSRTFRWVSLFLMAFISAYALIVILIYALYMCDPPAANYDPTVKGKCKDLNAYFYGTQVCCAMLDVFVLLLPLPMIRQLKLERSQKWWLATVFAFGYCVVIVPLVRIGLIAKYAWILVPSEDPDLTWNSVILDFAIVVEAPVAIVGLCLPPIFQLSKRVLRHGLSSLFKSRSYPSDKSDANPARTERDKQLKSVGSNAEMNRRLVKRLSEQNVNGQHGNGTNDVDEIALNNIYQRKDLSVMETDRTNSDDIKFTRESNPPNPKTVFPIEEV